MFIGSLATLFIIKSATFKKANELVLDKISRYGRYEYIYLPIIGFKALKSNFSKFEKINLEINFEDIIILEKLRTESLKKKDLPLRHLIPNIKLNLIHNEKKYRGDARFKGDRTIHYENKDTTSYKIELDKNNFLFGVKKFSLQKPIIRNYVHEWIFHELAKEFDLIMLRIFQLSY